MNANERIAEREAVTIELRMRVHRLLMNALIAAGIGEDEASKCALARVSGEPEHVLWRMLER